jgi:hypothetical protein
MAARTLASTWKQFERAAQRCQAGSGTKARETSALNEVVRKANASPIGEAIATLFVRPYAGMEKATVVFLEAGEEGFPSDRPVAFKADASMFEINPVGVIHFCQECREAIGSLSTPTARESFSRYRYQAYLSELSKLPTHLVLFLLVLQEVANARQISRVEKKGGEVEVAEDERYLNLLWAFNELESILARTSGLNLRGEYSVLWYESDWIVGR